MKTENVDTSGGRYLHDNRNVSTIDVDRNRTGRSWIRLESVSSGPVTILCSSICLTGFVVTCTPVVTFLGRGSSWSKLYCGSGSWGKTYTTMKTENVDTSGGRYLHDNRNVSTIDVDRNRNRPITMNGNGEFIEPRYVTEKSINVGKP
jgi:uncharacterized protein (DUF1330 family)